MRVIKRTRYIFGHKYTFTVLIEKEFGNLKKILFKRLCLGKEKKTFYDLHLVFDGCVVKFNEFVVDRDNNDIGIDLATKEGMIHGH